MVLKSLFCFAYLKFIPKETTVGHQFCPQTWVDTTVIIIVFVHHERHTVIENCLIGSMWKPVHCLSVGNLSLNDFTIIYCN